MNGVFTHLWSSTLVLLVALLAARFLPLTARTRYTLLLTGLLKLAIPFAAINALFRAIGIDLANLGPRSAGVVSIDWIGGPLTLRSLPPPETSRWAMVMAIAWIVPALALAITWVIARRRLLASALEARCAASSREHSALTAARLRLGLQVSVDLTRSRICEAPAVVRIIRPLVILPDGGCDVLDDAELESLLRHECAHVARRDNLFGLAESAIVAAFWFHPLVWIAQRALSAAREEACDETAASTPDALDTYVSALTKICRAVIAPRLTGVSCMASAHLKERMNHLMRYEFLRTRALSHRLVVLFTAAIVVAVTIGSGLRAAPSSDSKNTPFKLAFVVRPGEQPDTLVFKGRVTEVSTDQLLAQPNVTFKKGSTASIRTVAEDREIQIDLRDTGGTISAVMRVSENGVRQQESTYFAVPQTDRPRDTRYTGALISLDLKDAEIKNVLDTFGKLTGLKVQYSPTLQGKVTLKVKDMPWDEAFDIILRQNSLTYQLTGDVIIIK